MSAYKLAKIAFISLWVALSAHADDNLQTCLSGKYHSLCNYSDLTESQRAQANEARRRENLNTCLSGKYTSLCEHSLLTSTESARVVDAEKRENLRTCLTGKYKSLCKHELLSAAELERVKESEKRENLSTCMNGAYPSLCNHSLLSTSERAEATRAEEAAAKRTSQVRAGGARPIRHRARDSYLIEVAHDDELFIINGEKYEAQTYCLGWEEGEEVIFVEGSALGACASATIYNLNRQESCDVWCE